MIENKTVSYSQIEEGYITAKRIVGKEINFLGGSSMKLTEFIEKYGDRKIDEQKLKETLNIESKGWVPE